ncbi:hypothetical protein L211DRAFT_850096 [Terfezia boudieri ATCC MYA-4762]|uniref:Dicer-like protein 2 n=1 Tax=Terfezia boudieri ATCC MYA-4762 TaxID=1051890 RepID=A0A3N4LJI3_9PEZI|nr:hypothetical protein L211DRAFT_850096 [Terfezia boudieri ATCC MYA-4762]
MKLRIALLIRHLGEQQFSVLQAQLPPVPMKLLSGNDRVEKWNSEIWDAILASGDESTKVRVVILLDALTHGFVSMDDLSLIVFDEAHHCIYDHPANRIMKNFYHPRVEHDEYLPAILGLTASPLFNGAVDQLPVIESNLNAICRTPTTQRAALNQHSRLPNLHIETYSPIEILNSRPSLSYTSLVEAYGNMDIENDPYIQSLSRESEKDERQYQKVLTSGSYPMQQMKALVNKCAHVCEEYGSWPVDFYINIVINRYMQLVRDRGDEFVDWLDEEKTYLKDILSEVDTYELSDASMMEPGSLSPKMEKLIEVLVEEYEADMARGEQSFSGIIFVEQRVGVSVVAEILSRHPKTKNIFKCGTLVGSSQNPARAAKNLTELVDPKRTDPILADFRAGKKNLIVATSVAEEGLDVQACHLVVCCYMQQTKKSYVQMRGRARRKNSTYVLMFPDEDTGRVKLQELKKWEKEMLEAYQDETRKLREREETELEDEVAVPEKYYIAETKALLTYDSSISHLHHFCAVIPHSQHMDFRPEFYPYQERAPVKVWTAELTLPACIPPELRKFKAKYLWENEKMAERDVAFQAYTTLHKKGLVDNHLMPLPTKDQDVEMDDIAKKTSTEAVPLQMDPFERNWERNESGEVKTYISEIYIRWESGERVQMNMILPFACPRMGNFDLWWTRSEPVRVMVNDKNTPTYLTSTQFKKAQEDTYTLFSTVLPGRIEKNRLDFSYLFTLDDGVSSERISGMDILQAWDSESTKSEVGIVRDITQVGKLYLFKAWNYEATIPQEEMEKRYPTRERLPNTPLLEVTPVTKRRNFSQRCMNRSEAEVEEEERARIRESKSTFLLPQATTFDRLPWRVERSTLLIPCILRRLEIYAIAKELQDTVMAPVGFKYLPHIVTAITASSAGEETDYQRYELLGDSVLKFLVGIQLLTDYPLWHEGYLSGKKDRSVANSKLTQESMRLKMSRFIITNHFSPLKWKAKYLPTESLRGSKPEAERGGRDLSSKVLADVVESLIGAAYLEGSFDKALKVAQIFGLGMKWDTLENRVDTLYERATPPEGMHFPPHLHNLEKLLGYTFNQKSLLLEAITHPSLNTDNFFVSYQRMEFLGDSVLDMAIVDRLFLHEKRFSHADMHLYKSASVNEYFLGFLCLNQFVTVEDEEKETHVDRRTGVVTLISKDKHHHLFRFLRHSNFEVAKMQETAYRHYLRLREDILAALQRGKDFPWTLLAGVNAEKFFSDMIESLLGAIFIDSHGSFDVVNAIIEKLGIYTILDRLLQDSVNPLQPIQKLGIYAAQNMNQARTKYVQNVDGGQYVCEVMINEEVIVRVAGGVSKQEVQIRAAEMAYTLLVEREGREGKSEEKYMTLRNEETEQEMDVEMNAVEQIMEVMEGKGKESAVIGNEEEDEAEAEDINGIYSM